MATPVRLSGVHHNHGGTYEGAIDRRDITENGFVKIIPWDFQPNWSSPSDSSYPGSSCSLQDLKGLANDQRIGAACISAYDFSNDFIRLDDKYFGTTIRGDDYSRTIFDVLDNNLTKAHGRYYYWIGTNPASKVSFGADYISFDSDDVWFAMYADQGRGAGAEVTTIVTVKSGQGELWRGQDSPEHKVMDLVAGVNTTTVEMRGDNGAGQLFIKRKNGSAFQMSRLHRGFMGSSITEVAYDQLHFTSEQLVTALEYAPGGNWIVNGPNVTLTNMNRDAGTGTMTLAANGYGNEHSIRWTGQGASNAKVWPAGGLRLKAMLPASYGTTGFYTLDAIKDWTDMGVRVMRNLGPSNASAPIADIGQRRDNYITKGMMIRQAEIGNRMGLREQKLNINMMASRADIKQAILDWHNNADEDIICNLEAGNEPWNNNQSTFFSLKIAGDRRNVTGYRIYAEQCHELFDICEEIKSETGTTRPFVVTPAWQTYSVSIMRDNVFNVVGGVRNERLIDRMCLNEQRLGTIGRYSQAPYFGAGVSAQSLINAVGSGATAEQYRVEFLRQMTLEQTQAVTGHNAQRNALRQVAINAGYPADSLQLDAYEFSRHPAFFSGEIGNPLGYPNEAMRTGVLAAEIGDEMAALQAKHNDEICAKGGSNTFFSSYGRWQERSGQPERSNEGFWGFLMGTGADRPNFYGGTNRTKTYTALTPSIQAANDPTNNPTPTPTPTPGTSPFEGVGIPGRRVAIVASI